ncbi:MAG: IMP dehydrogenase [Desulfosudis oleivorans]|nr:IMP dehydrogenase [Desulfosudis oleivorans]
MTSPPSDLARRLKDMGARVGIGPGGEIFTRDPAGQISAVIEVAPAGSPGGPGAWRGKSFCSGASRLPQGPGGFSSFRESSDASRKSRC